MKSNPDKKFAIELDQAKRLAYFGAALDEHAILSMTNAAGEITYVNQKFIDISGYSIAELLGKNHRMVKSGLHPATFYQEMWDTLLSGKTWHGEVCNRRKSGALYWVRATIKPILDENGLPEAYVSVRTDITEVKQTEENARRNQVLMRSVIDAIPDLIFFKDRDGKYLGCNAAFEQYFGTPEALIIDKTDFDFVDQETAIASREQDRLMLASEKALTSQKSITYPDGRRAVVEVVRTPYEYGGESPGVIGISHDITEKLKREQELRIARDHAISANKAKSEFLSHMSHELRTPMNAILGFAQLMEGDKSCTADQHENLQQISKAGWHLLDLINEVLDLARVESGEVKFEIEDVDASAIISECLLLLSPLISGNIILVENNISVQTVHVRADYLKLKQVLINFLSNAIKYNRDGGKVLIESASDGSNSIKLSIRDTGIGMTAGELEKLFEPFTRFGDINKVQGTGIGLSICKKLIEGMGGKVQVESVYGEGSVFSVILPLAAKTMAPASTGASKISLLYIENDSAQQALIGKWVANKGWHLDFASDAATGIDSAMKCGYDGIMLDMDLPGGFSGFEVKSILDEMESQRGVPVIGFSKQVQHADIEKAKQAGFSAYLAKPVDFPELDRAIQSAIRGGAAS